MPSIIEIQNGLVSIVNREVEAVVPLADWIAHVERRPVITIPTLPVGTVSVSWDTQHATNKRMTLLIEREPHIMNLDFEGEIHRLSVPYIRFAFACVTDNAADNLSWYMERYQVYMAKERFRDPTKRDMITALLPNVYSDGRICFGSTAADADQTIAERLNQTVNEFFVSEFNHDLHIRRPNGWTTWRRWETMTRNNPMGWMDWAELGDAYVSQAGQSFEQVAGQNPSEFAPVIAANPIPPLEIGASFGRVNEWFDALEPAQRERLHTLISYRAAETPEAFVGALAEEDEDDDE